MGDWKERYKNLYNRFSKRQRYIMLGAALAILIAIIGVSAWYGNMAYTPFDGHHKRMVQ